MNHKNNNINLAKYLDRSVKMFLINGVKITGTVKEVYDDGLMVVNNQHPDQDIFRHAIASISEQDY